VRRGLAALLALCFLGAHAVAVRAVWADEPPARIAPAPAAPVPAVPAPAGPTIAVLSPPGDRLGLRIVAELESLGFRAALVGPPPGPASRASLEGAARGANAIAAIRAVPSDRGVEVWVADRVTGKTVLREVASDGAPDDDGALALRAVELLRASLLEIALPEPPRGEVAPPPDLRAKMAIPPPGALAEPPPPSLRFSLEGGVLASPSGLDPAAALELGLAWMPLDHVGAAAFVSIPLTAPSASAQQGSVSLRALFAGGGVRFVFTSPASRWAPSVDLGLVAAVLDATGTGSPGFLGKQPSGVTAAPFARAGVAFAVSRLFRLRADLLVGVLAQGVSLRIVNSEVATWGQPFALASAGVDFGWF
jgi:hypothetical protein